MTRDELLQAYARGERNFRYASLRGANLRGVDLWGVDLRGAYLGGVDLRGADLWGVDLRGAYLGGVDLRGADLGGVDLRGADLRDVDLWGVDLRGADLGDQWIIQGPTRSDGYYFNLTNFTEEGVRVKAGCRNFSLADARAHWETLKGTPLGDETFAILDCLESLAKARDYKL